MVVVITANRDDVECIIYALALMRRVVVPLNVTPAIRIRYIATVIFGESVELIAGVLGNGASERHTLQGYQKERPPVGDPVYSRKRTAGYATIFIPFSASSASVNGFFFV